MGFAAQIILTFLLLPAALLRPGEVKVSQDALRADVEFLSDSLCAGRAAGSAGGVEAASYISRRLSGLGYSVSVQPFAIDSSRVGHNILAHSAAGGPPPLSNRGCYVPQGASLTPLTIVMASYDGLGMLGGRLYPGADSNASGVAALLALAERLKDRKDVLLVFTDARNAGGGGARALKTLLYGLRIALVVNIDIIGASLAPVDEYWPDYLIALGADRYKNTFERCNRGLQLHLYYSYYRSRAFTDLFYRRNGDHAAFVAAGVPVILFTSGITGNTNKPSDTFETLDYDVFARRVEFISRFISYHGRR